MRHHVKRRVIHLAGYDPMSAVTFHARFARELPRFQRAWGAKMGAGPLEDHGTHARWTVTGTGPDWTTETEHLLICWDDVINQQRARPALARWPLGALSGLDFIWNGALWGYLRHGPRYVMFFAFPFVIMALCVLAGWFAATLVAGFGWLAALAAGVGVTAGLLLLAGHRLFLDHLLDDWIFASEVVRKLHPTLAERLAIGRAAIEETPADTELVVIGHSLGAALAAEMLATTLRTAPDGRPIGVLTLGSSILKIALHRGASRLREAVGTIAASPRVSWAEYQAVNDVMNFFRTDPVKVLALAGQGPVVRKASFGKMLDPAYYKRIQLNFFRLHCQFISGNDRRAPYDYLMVVAGPFGLMPLAASSDGAAGWLDANGALTETGRAALGRSRVQEQT